MFVGTAVWVGSITCHVAPAPLVFFLPSFAQRNEGPPLSWYSTGSFNKLVLSFVILPLTISLDHAALENWQSVLVTVFLGLNCSNIWDWYVVVGVDRLWPSFEFSRTGTLVLSLSRCVRLVAMKEPLLFVWHYLLAGYSCTWLWEWWLWIPHWRILSLFSSPTYNGRKMFLISWDDENNVLIDRYHWSSMKINVSRTVSIIL